MDGIKKNCPICESEILTSLRYPNYICNNCASKATDVDGKLVQFYNISMLGGFMGQYVDTREPYDNNLCYVNGVECEGKEAKFGGTLIEIK